MYEQIIQKSKDRGLPVELVNLILSAQGSAFLEAIATASSDQRFTDLFLPLYHPIAAEISQRWLHIAQHGTSNQEVNALSSLARILPFATYLEPKLKNFLRSSRVIREAVTNVPFATALDDEHLQTLLLALFRLSSHDLDAFTDLIKPVFLCSLFSHESLPVRFLAIECFCQAMRFADALNQDLIRKYVGTDQVLGSWEGNQIDFRLLKLYEERRWLELRNSLKSGTKDPQLSLDSLSQRFCPGDLSSETACIAGVLLPRDDGVVASPRTTFVMTETAAVNMRAVAKTLHHFKPTLLSGPSGAGKTAIVLEVARQVNKLSDLVTLHLNDQTDAKSLLGIYTSSTSGNAFTWQPGVLTKAVQEGRWVLIEDIDRAPAEVIGLLKPLIENNELFLSSRKERLRPKDGFRIIGIIRNTNHTRSASASHHAFSSNPRLWSTVPIVAYPDADIRQILQARFENLIPSLDSIMAAHSRIVEKYAFDPAFKAAQGRIASIRDLLKWCRRLSNRIRSRRATALVSIVPETFMIDMLKDSIDCYASHLNDNELVYAIAATVAEVINISPAALDHAVKNQNPVLQHKKRALQVGRSSLANLDSKVTKTLSSSKFALTRRVRQNMEAIISAVDAKEPLLLVGETGVGKTTIVQHIAGSIGQNITVVNLSNQSEASDLLGGLKPVTTRSLIVPLVDEFNNLFDETFSANKNEKFQGSVAKAFAKQRWSRLVGHWGEAHQLALKTLPNGTESDRSQEQATKRRKLDQPKYQALRERWATFANSVNQIKAQIQRGEQNQMFAFVESRLVQAVRNGAWLLLDEINLASPETLDNILSLFQDGEDDHPYLLLAETGNIERIQAHPNFRIFAAMNPATDTGKKDLPPAIRSHFTELFVHSGDSDVNDLTEIVQVYLSSALENDKRASADLANAYLALKELSAQHKLTDGAGDLPHFSLRSLTRCLQYVQQHALSHGLRRAMHEGMQMSFFTVLDSSSQRIAFPAIEQYLLASPQAKRAMSSQKPKMTFDPKQYVTLQHHLILKGSEQIADQAHYIRTASVEHNLVNLARAASMRRFPILLQGPTSAGKTSMVEYLAKYSGNKFVRINNHEHTDLQEYLGSYASGSNGKLEYREGVLVEALRKGYWIVLDELNLAPSDVLEALNRLLDDNRELLIPESQEIVRPHPNFILFATQNPAGLYGGRKRLSRAFRNRFLEIHVDDIPEEELEIILKERAQIAPSFCRQIVEVYKKLSLQRQSSRLFEQRNSFATLRDLFRWASRPVDDREQLAYHGYMLLAERVRETSEKAVVKLTIEETLKVKLDDDQLYSMRNLPSSVTSIGSITWTHAMRRLFLLVSAALSNNEPVLLVGETGCGKTQVCQTIAQAFGKHLDIYNAHSNTETGDLIGSQRPVRHKSELAEALVQDLQSLGDAYSAKRSNDNIGIEELIYQFKNMDTSTFDKQAVDKVNRSIAAYQSLFVWNNGSLVRAMKNGSHFLLDEISLADDSVLERMNSLLEPARTILLAEKGAEDNLVVAEPGFQFLATMNPGGDYGKRELSAALRNRLTEIWVPPVSDIEDVLPILRSRLDGLDTRIASVMLDFAQYFRSQVQASGTNSIPLRTLLGWADFVTRNSYLGTDVALVHGAALTYIDSLGANPAGMTNSLIGDIKRDREKCLAKLSGLLSTDADAVYNAYPALEVTHSRLRIGSFSIQRSAGAAGQDDLVLDAPTTLKNAMRIVRALQTSRPLLLEGNPGVGKTAIISTLAKICGRPLTRINLSDQTDLMDLFGADAPAENEKLGRFVWRDGPLLKAMKIGGWVLLDEMNLASQSVLEGLNACLDHRQEVYIAELDRVFRCHPDFTLFATQNPHHQGGGRKGLPASFVNRFTVVYADPFQREDLITICKLKFPAVSEDQIIKVVASIDESQTLASQRHEFVDGGPWELNLRDLGRWFSLCDHYNMLEPNEHFDTIVAQRFRSEAARRQAIDSSQSVLGSVQALSLYNHLSPTHFQVGTAFMARDLAQQPERQQFPLTVSHLRYAKSVITALTQGWPVILAGGSGSGKTTLLRSLAALSGAKLVEFSVNTDVDTADLIGGYEQYDVQRELAGVLRELKTLLSTTIGQRLHHRQSDGLADLVAALSQIDSSDIDLPSFTNSLTPMVEQVPGLRELLKKLKALYETDITDTSRFVWNDGILIDALQAGSWVVIDNANLCNPSVLDRLNSLLEPNGCLVVSEQHGIDGEGRILRPHPNFRIILTMDPRFGELSRAMRNRSLEIFMEGQFPKSDEAYLPAYPTVSSISRLRLQSFAMSELLLKTTQELEPWMSYLAPQDLALDQAQSHFLHTKETQQLIQEEYRLRGSSDQLKDMRARVIDKSDSATPGLRRLLDDQSQPHVLLVNEPHLRMLLRPYAVEDVTLHTKLQFLFTALVRCQRYVNEQPQRTENVPFESLSILQRSTPAIQRRARRSEEQPIRAFEIIDRLANFCFGLFRASRTPLFRKTHSVIRDSIMLLLDMTSLFDQKSVSADHIQAYVQISLNIYQQLGALSPDLASTFRLNVIQLLVPSCVLNTGYGLQTMWPTWKGNSAETAQQIQAQIMMEQLINRFDVLSMALPHSRAQLSDVRLRLLEANSTVVLRYDAIAQIHILTAAIDELAQQQLFGADVQGHFASVFRNILAKYRLQNVKISAKNMQKMTLFGTNSSTPNSPVEALVGSPAEVLERLSAIISTIDDDQTISAAAPGDVRTEQVISRLQDVDDQPLARLDYAREEFYEIVQTFSAGAKPITAKTLEALCECTGSLLKHVLTSHQGASGPGAQEQPAENTSLTKAFLAESISTDETSASYLTNIETQYLLPASSHLEKRSNYDCGRALLLVSTACLKLLVTDKMFDPAIYPSLIRSRHEKRTSELTARIAAWKTFQNRAAGQDSSIIIRMLERELRELGEAPPAPSVYRPQPSQLDVLQAHYTNILRLVVMSDILADFLNPKVAKDPDHRQTGMQLISRIAVCVQRLSEVHRAYDDLVVPVKGLLQCLSLAVRIVLYEMEHPSSLASNSRLMPWSVAYERLKVDSECLSVVPSSQIWRLLESLRLRVLVEQPSGAHLAGSFGKIFVVIDDFYGRWKKQLVKDQADAEAQSKYYTYRGQDEGAEINETEVNELFPTYADDDAVPEHGDGRDLADESRTQQSAVELAKMHRSLFEKQVPEAVLRQYLQRFGVPSIEYRKRDDSLIPEHMPSVLLCMQDKLRVFEGDKQKSSFNIYTESSIVEARELFNIIKTTQTRFNQIAEKWPEHAVPAEVLAYCDQLMALKMNDPVAKMLTNTEKFLGIVAQWQAIASKEWSIMNIVDSLTALIIRWRRLELGSWSRLLDIEDVKQKDNADAWYFIAYEAVIFNSRLVIEQSEGISEFCQGLAKTLEEFLRATTLGQFSHRLGLLQVFSSTLCELAKNEVRLLPIQQTIANVIDHYLRYEEHVSKTLKDGRAALEKNITEQIKLASWKDTNIVALKESARRSHYKLFRIVKKYRTLLGQPVTSFETPGSTGSNSQVQAFHHVPQIHCAGISKHLTQCAGAITDWTSRPERLQNPNDAARTMHHAYQKSLSDFSASSKLHTYTDELNSSVKELRKATPSTLSDENISLIRDLKQRKRRLLAETMRNVAQMGIRRNLGTAELAKQGSTSLILAQVPHMDSTGDLPSASVNEMFHELLDAMPLAREAALEHSEELTNGEVRRGLGYLEGLLNLVIKQRIQCCYAQTALQKFRERVKVLGSLQASWNALTISSRAWPAESTAIRDVSSWASASLKVFADIAEFQDGHGSLNLNRVIGEMRQYSSQLREGIQSIEALQNLPQGLQTDQTRAAYKQPVHVIANLVEDLRTWQEQQPQIEHLTGRLQKLIAEEAPVPEQKSGRHSTNIIAIDKKTKDLLNSIFVALQNMVGALKDMPTTTDEQGWLVQIMRASIYDVSLTRLDKLDLGLEEILESLHRLDAGQLRVGASVILVAAPIVQQFAEIYQHLHDQMLRTHTETCRLAVFLSKSFTTLAREGFCGPAEASDGQEKTGKVEQGTGLGEGGATEDISKDVGDDEDLTDLAQTTDEREEAGEEMEKSKDAVDMGVDDLEGETGSGDERASDDEDGASQASEEEGQDIDEETGSVDDLDPSAVDEKMWDDMQKEAEGEQKEMKSQKADGKESDEHAAKQEDAKQEHEGDDLEASEEANDENEDREDVDGQQKAEGENLDPHLQEEQALDLPEEMQLNGEEEKTDEMSDMDMDEMSDLESAPKGDQQVADLPNEDQIAQNEASDQQEIADGEDDDDAMDGTAEDDKVVEDQPAEGEEAQEESHDTRQNHTAYDAEDQENGEAGVANTNKNDADEQTDENAPEGQNDAEHAAQQPKPQGGKQSASQEQGSTNEGVIEQGIGRNEEQDKKQNKALQKLADVLEQYHRRREIFTASEDRQQGQADQDVDMAEADFEHLVDEEDEGQTQALGSANNDVAQNLDRGKAIEESGTTGEDDLPIPNDADKDMQNVEQEPLADKFSRLKSEQEAREQQHVRGAIVPDSAQERPRRDLQLIDEMQIDEDIVEAALLAEEEQAALRAVSSTSTSMEEAQKVWSLATNRTQALSLMLTEQLRLILQPTTATKLRGDFRTGKRLNIRRIIPYIASGYKRDKIWMRRSVPSKRNYQIMLAVDDSKSMAESGADVLALETLCMLSRSLSMLEVGELSIVAFGQDYSGASNVPSGASSAQAVKVAHPFPHPFSPNQSGPTTFSNFTFNQTGTNVKALLADSIKLFSEARLKSSAREASDLWQLQIIISDGHIGSDSDDSVRQLVRKAREEKIMCVFVVVDSGEESIVDLKEVTFEKEKGKDGKEGGDMVVKTRKYLENFPFQYYVVVREVRDLPGVLSRVLKGWFEGVVEQG